jgi:hypothetical protein
MPNKNQSLAAIGMFALLLCASAAQATSQRTFVSGTGLDTNPCSLSAPCRSFAGALVNTLPGGEIYVLDTAGYGAVTINKAVSIVNQTSTAGATATSGDAITINAGAGDQIVLRGLTIVGAGTASHGITFNTGGSLTVEDCSISQFTGLGIFFQPTSSAELSVSNTRLANIAGYGILVQPAIPSVSATIKITFERVEARNNTVNGIVISGGVSGSGTSIAATIADSVAADNTNTGIVATSVAGHAPVTTMVRNTVTSNNGTGIVVNAATLYLGHSTISGNTTALSNLSGTLASYGDNNIDGNTSPGSSPSAVAFH